MDPGASLLAGEDAKRRPLPTMLDLVSGAAASDAWADNLKTVIVRAEIPHGPFILRGISSFPET
jgi:hypothetical protein